MPDITLARADAYTDHFRPYRIYIDGEKRGTIKVKETKTFPVSEGRHDIQLRIDWNGSPKLALDVPAAGVRLTCRSNVNPFSILFSIFAGDRWISLDQA